MRYFAISLVNLRAKLTYRGNELVKLAVQVSRMLVSIWMWVFIYNHSTNNINGFSLSVLIQYLVLVTILSTLFSTAPIFRLSKQIQSGRFTTILTRPISVFWEGLAAHIGSQLLIILFVAFSLMVMVPVVGAIKVVVVGAYLTLGFFMFYALTMFCGTLSFWLINMWPLRSAINALFLILGGQYFPLSFLGKDISMWLQYNPFSLLTDVPARYFSGQVSNSDYPLYFMALLLWTVLFSLGYRVMLRRGSKRYEGVGS